MIEEEKPLVSIVIPTFNGAEFLREAIDSVLNQTYSNIELIVIDDGSKDNTREILEAYSDKFQWFYQENSGQAKTLNKGWEISKGDIISYLSSDDKIKPNCVEESVEYLKSNKYVLTYCNYDIFDENSIISKVIETPDYNYKDLVSKLICQPGPGVFFKKEVFNKIGGWDGTLKQTPDLEYWMRIGKIGEFKKINLNLAQYRIHDKSTSYAFIPVERANEPLRMVNKFFSNINSDEEVFLWKNESISNAFLISARMHIMSLRYKEGLLNFFLAIKTHFPNLYKIRTWKLIINGLVNRV